jgi:hypothetical protein
MSKVDCKDCQFYHNGRCEELGEYTTPGERECSWFAAKAIKKTCVAEIAKNAKQTVFDQITTSPEVLAEKMVFRALCVDVNRVTYSCWKSTITEEAYRTKPEAIAATVAKLKEQAQ